MAPEVTNAGEIASLIQMVKDAGLVGLLIIIILGGYRQWWVWGYQLTDMRGERDWWRETATRGTNMAEKAVDLAVKK